MALMLADCRASPTINGGDEAYAFQNLVVLTVSTRPKSGGAPSKELGSEANGTITGLDENHAITLSLVSDDLTGGLTVGSQTGGGAGEPASLPYTSQQGPGRQLHCHLPRQ